LNNSDWKQVFDANIVEHKDYILLPNRKLENNEQYTNIETYPHVCRYNHNRNIIDLA